MTGPLDGKVAHKLNDMLRWKVGYAFFTNDEEYTGGANDYDASLVTTSLDVTF